MPSVDVTIRAIDQGSQNVQKFSTSLSGIAAKAITAGVSLGALKAAFSSVEAVARAAFAALNEGAQLELAQSRFENLAVSIGTTADALTNDMGKATQGMMSQANMVSAASDIISLGLADSGEEVVRLSNLVGQLGWDMQVLTLTMANDSMLRLDALGLSMTDVKERMEDLKAAGVSADEAFDLAVIEAGEAKLELMGSAADSTAGKLQVLTASVENVQNAFKMGFAEGFTEALDEVAGGAPAAAAGLADLAHGLGLLSQYIPDVVEGLTSVAMPAWVFEIGGALGIIGVAVGKNAQATREAADASAAWADDLWNTQLAAEMQAEALAAAADATSEYGDALIKTAAAEDGVAVAASNVGDKIRALAGLADVAAEAMARGADKAGVMAAAMRGLGDVAKENFLAQQAEAAEELAQFYDEVAGRMADSFTAALQPEGKMNFGNADAMAESAWSIAQAYDLTAVQIGNVGIALDEITPKQAEAAAKASIFQEAWGNLLGQFGAGNIDTEGLMAAYDQLIADLESKSLIEIQVELGQVKNPPRDSWAWLPKEEREPIETPVEFTPEQAALSSAIDLLDGIPANTEKLITFEAEYAEITDTAIPAIEAAITAIDAKVLMAPETAELDAKIELINESRLTMYVDFVVGDTSAIPGRAAGGAVSGDSPYIIGEAGPELFVPWTNGTVVPNHRIAQSVGGGGGINMTMNFYGPATAADVRRAADDAGRRLLEQVRRAGVAV